MFASIADRAIAYLDAVPPAISGQGGHAAAVWAARCVVLGFDLGPEIGYQLLAAHYNPRCVPPWSEAELRHKCQEADAKPFDKVRGWLLHEANASRNGTASHKGGTGNRAAAAEAPDPPKCDGVAITLDWWRSEYDPRFRRDDRVYSATRRRELHPSELLRGPPSVLRDLLAHAEDVPRNKQRKRRLRRIPAEYRTTWGPVALADLLRSLPDEADLDEVTDPAGEEFRRELGGALDRLVTLSRITEQKDQIKEAKSILDWCKQFAAEGGWQSVRSYRVWCRKVPTEDGSSRTAVAIRAELFTQIGVSGRLARMGHREFAALARLYGVGTGEECRPGGKTRCLVLSQEFIEEQREAPKP